MQKPENITQRQWEHLIGHLKEQPKITVTETGTFETRMVGPTAEQIEASRRRRGLIK